MQQQYVAFIENIFASGHAEVAPPLREHDECWYLPKFGIYHPQKPNQIRVVFDSSTRYSRNFLNDVLLTGPELKNSLKKTTRLWHKDNDISKEVVEYRMKVHIFGNGPSPAVAINGLRRAIREGAQEHGANTVKFV